MEIIYSNRELDKRRLYAHTRAEAIPLKEIADGEIINPMELVIYTDIDNTGEIKELVSIADDQQRHFASSSPSLIRELKAIIELMGDEPYQIKIRKRLSSKGGRTYTTCELV